MSIDGNERFWSAPPELAGVLNVKIGHTKDEIVEMESLARSLGWVVMPHEPCKTCEKIRGKTK